VSGRRLVLGGVPCGLVVLWPAMVMAHPLGGVGDFYAGMAHPLMAFDSLLTLLAIGLLAGQQRRETAIAMLLVVASAVVTGGGIGRLAPMPVAVAWTVHVWMILLGVLVAWLPRPSFDAITIVVAIPALVVGWSNGTEAGNGVAAPQFVAGLALSALLLIIYAAGGVRQMRRPWMAVVVRVAGSWIAAVGVLLASLP
jgi:urease accessory protein